MPKPPALAPFEHRRQSQKEKRVPSPRPLGPYHGIRGPKVRDPDAGVRTLVRVIAVDPEYTKSRFEA